MYQAGKEARNSDSSWARPEGEFWRDWTEAGMLASWAAIEGAGTRAEEMEERDEAMAALGWEERVLVVGMEGERGKLLRIEKLTNRRPVFDVTEDSQEPQHKD